MSENNDPDTIKLAVLVQRHEDLAEDVKELKRNLNTTLETMQKTLTNIELQTSKWKSVGTGIFLTISGVWVIFQWFFGDIHDLLHSIKW